MNDGQTSSWKIPLYLLLFGILTVSSVVFKNFGTHVYSRAEVAGRNGNLQEFSQPESGRMPIVTAINAAQKEILVEVYLLSDKEIISALVAAKDRGVNVQVMLEQHPFGGGNINQQTATALQQSGINFKWTNPTFALTHEKAIVIDQEQAFIMNQNLTQSSFKSNREFDIIDHNLSEVTEVRQIFLADWNRSGYTPKEASLVVSPDNARGKLAGLINSANKTLEIEAEVIQDNDMIKLLGDHGKQEEVRIILPDFKKVPANLDAAKQLKSAGVQVKTIRSPYVHAKLIIADGTHAYVGSVNLTDASLDQNREVGILVGQSDIIDSLNQSFSQDWDRAVSF